MSIRLSSTVVATAVQATANTNHITSAGSAHSLVQDSTVKSTHTGVSLVTGALNQVDTALVGSAGKLFKPEKIIVTCTDNDCPAFLKGGTGATAVVATWEVVNNGQFQINVDGAGVTTVTCDFTAMGVGADMDDVAGVIQAALQTAFVALAPNLPTCVWATDHFVISSGNNDPAVSAITAATAGLAGTDISGAGATAFLDCDAGAADEEIHLPPSGGAATITVGTSHAGTEILPATVLTGLVGVGQAFEIALTGLFPSIAGNATLHVTSTVGDGAVLATNGTFTVRVDVLGTQS